MQENNHQLIQLPSNFNFSIFDGFSLRDCVNQLQKYNSDILCVIDDRFVRPYPRNGPFPSDIRVKSITHRVDPDGRPEVVFQSLDGTISYCLYGEEEAQLFFPPLLLEFPDRSLNGKETISINNRIIRPCHSVSDEAEKSIIIYDEGLELTFANPNHSLIITVRQRTS